MRQVFDRAVARHNAGDPAGAGKLYRKILKAEPNHPVVLNLAGVAAIQSGAAKSAVELLSKAIAVAPDYAEAHYNFAKLLSQLGRLEEAVESYRAALALEPRNAEAHNNIGLALQDLGRMEEAMESYRHAVAANPTHAKAHYHLGNALRTAGQLDQAAACYGRALAVEPNYTLAHNNLGLTQQELGLIEEARASFRRAIAGNGDYAPARVNLAALNEADAGAGDIAEMERLLGAPDLAADDAIQLRFALGRARGEQGADERAFGHIVAGNRLKRDSLNYDGAAMGHRFTSAAETFDAAFFARHGNAGMASALPIFILGMPRSGTTLVEQILASHPAVHGAGELHELAATAASLPARIGSGRPYPECAKDAAPGSWAELGADYVEALARRAPGKARVCDKMPNNFLRIGLIHLMLPNASIIHCRRDAMDTCFSCFSLLFSDGQLFSYDLTELGLYYRQYDALMRHWRQVLPNRVLEVRYEDVVGDLEASARRLLAHCGLDWDDRCLDFHQTRRAVRTASLTQVRRPIYASSIGRWRRHENQLAPLIAALGPLADPGGPGAGIGNSNTSVLG